MRNKFTLKLKSLKSFVITLILLLVLFNFPVTAAKYFISPSGNDNNTGTISSPFLTLNKSWTKVSAGDTVYLRGGTYTLTSQQVLNGKNGTASKFINVWAYNGEIPVITYSASVPGITLTGNYISFKGIEINGLTTLSGWTNVGNGIYSKNLTCAIPEYSTVGSTNMVLLNGVNTPLGRYPNSNATNGGYLTIDSHSGTSSITDAELPSSPNFTGGELVVRRNHWSIDRSLITNQTSSVINYSAFPNAKSWDIQEPRDGYGYFVQNNINTLDQLGEWCYNGITLSMYFGTNNPTSYIIKASTVNDLIFVNNSNNVTFEGMSFIGGNCTSFKTSYCNYLTINNCEINYSGKYGIHCSDYSSHLQILNSTINNSNSCAIRLESENNDALIRGNKISNTGVLPGMGAQIRLGGICVGISSYMSDNTIVEYNKIINSGYNGIYLDGIGSIIRNNFIDTFCSIKDDGGGVYLYGADASVLREIKNNIILNGVGAIAGTTDFNNTYGFVGNATGIYMDERTVNVEISGNTVANCNYDGIYLHDVTDMNVHDNTLYKNKDAQINMVHDNNVTPDFPLRNIKINNNITVTLTHEVFGPSWTTNVTQKALVYGTTTNDIALFGVSDNNYFVSPLDNDPKFYTWYQLNSGYGITKTFSEWKTYSKLDAGSHLSPVTVPDISYIRFEYNDTTINKTVTLDGTYVDAKNTKFVGSITLLPYTSAVLMRISNVTQNPTNQVPSIQNQVFQVNKNSSNGTTVGTVVATDPDAGQSLTYSILSGNTNGAFAINSTSGAIIVANSNGLVTGSGGSDYSLFQSVTPAISSVNYIGTGTAPLEVGMKFFSNVDGNISGFRFYKGVGAQGTHIGNLWSINGNKLASATFTNETSSGWQTVTLSTPVAITANTIYIVSYFSSHGDYVKTVPFFTNDIMNGPLTGIGWTTTQPNGVYIYSAISAFPNNNNYVTNTNYWADVIFSSTTAPTSFNLVVKVQDNGAGNLSNQANITVNLLNGIVNNIPAISNQAFSINENSANGITVGSIIASDPDAGQSLTYSILSGNTNNAFTINSSTGVITVANSTALNYEATPTFVLAVKVQDNGTGNLSNQANITVTLVNLNEPPIISDQIFMVNSNSVNGTIVGSVIAADPDAGQTLTYSILSGNTSGAYTINSSTGVISVANASVLGVTSYSLFQSVTPPSSTINSIGTGNSPLEVGMKFKCNIDGYITGFRFYKGVGGQGTHIGNLWSITGTNLATATFTNETASGWQTVTLSTPVAIVANTIYIVSYFSQHGDFVKTDPYFTSNIVNGPLTGLGWTSTEPNGIYKYSSSSSFPNISTYAGKSNYWADVIFSSTLPVTSSVLAVKVQDNGAGNLSSQATVTVYLNIVKSANMLSIVSVPQDTVPVGSLYFYEVLGFSGNESLINYAVEDLPSWLSFSDYGNGTGIITGIPGIENIGSNQITLIGRNNIQEVQQIFTIEVKSNLLKGDPKNKGIHIYPNPVANGTLNVILDEGIKEKYDLMIFDMTGKALIRKQDDQANSLSLDLSVYSSGTYILQIRSLNHNFSDKFILK